MSRGFSIDGIEDVFRTDVLRLTGALRDRLKHLQTQPDDLSAIDDARATGHSLKGTASLVGLDHLSRCGAVLERMAEVGSTFARVQPDEARRIYRAMADALDLVEQLLERCLNRADDAVQAQLYRRLYDQLPEQLRRYLDEDQLAPASPPAEVTTASAAPPSAPEPPSIAVPAAAPPSPPAAPPAPSSAGADDDEFAKELAEVFALELQEQLESVPAEVKLLGSMETRPNACNRLNRIFHTIKGSAAMVGLRDLSETAKRLEKFFAETANLLTPAIESAQADIAQIFSTAGVEVPQLIAALAPPAAAAVPAAPVPPRAPAAAPAAPAPSEARPAPEIDLERELLAAFVIDANEAIEKCERLLLELETQPEDRQLLNALFRQFHTLKGAAGAVGLDRAAAQLHHGESLLESVIEGSVSIAPSRLVDFLFRITDSITALVNVARGVDDPRKRVMENLEQEIAALRGVTSSVPPAPERPAAPPAAAVPPAVAPAAPRPVTPPTAAPSAPFTPIEPPAFAQETEAGVVRVQASRLDALLNQVGQLVVTRTRMDQKIQSFAELRDKLEYCRTRLAATIEGFQKRFEYTIGEPYGMPVPVARAGDGGHGARLELTTPRGEGEQPYGRGVDDFFTELEFDKYDDFNILARSVIELATDTGEVADQLGDFMEALGEEVRQFSKITSGLQRQITNLRLVPVDVVFRRLLRPIRDAARQEGKLVEVEFTGGEVQLDRGVVEALYAPLLHIVRNAVSHGIELPAVREAHGKPRSGTLRIHASSRHNSVTLTVADDGAGIDYEKILAKGRSLGLIEPGAQPPRDVLLSLIFRPGFSTQEGVTDLAGRGVGMDVVARQVNSLNGSVVVESKEGHGTTIRLALPITTSIDEVLILEVGDQRYALAVDFVDRVVAVEAGSLMQEGPQLVLEVGEELVPTLLLAPLVGEAASTENSVAVVLRAGDRVMALAVDQVLGQREVVIRPLNRMLAAHPFLSGATISGAGEVVFVLHAGRLFEMLGFTSDQLMDIEIAREEARQEAPLEARTILVVDDSISVRKLAARFLESEGLEVETAVDGLDALEKLAQKPFRVVLSDLEMPRMHGYDLIEAIKNNPRLAHLPIIVCTSRASDKHRRRAQDLGAAGYVTKPFSKDELLAEIERVAPLPGSAAARA